MPLTPRGKKIMKSMKERYGKKKGEQVFYATKNKGKLKGVEKAYLGKAIKQPSETKKEFEMRHAYHTPFMKKPKGFRGGGMDMGSKASQEKSAAMGNQGSGQGRDPSKQFEDKASISQVSRDALQAQRKTAQYTLSPSTSPQGKALAFGAGLIIPGGGYVAKKLMDRIPYWKRGKRTTPTVMDTKEGRDDAPQKIIKPIEVETPKPVDPLLIDPLKDFFNFKAYKVGGLSGGVRYGPAPKRGPNPQVPPVKMKKGGYKK